jgi:diadenosine tetraphosphatase ApaH/serine/threonine PP2A family protein phosphatase
MSNRLIVYGDIHGCLDEFILLRQSLNIKAGDIETSVGDFLSKGLQSVEVLQFIRLHKILPVIGNHEDKILRYLRHQEGINKNPVELNNDEKNIIKNLNSNDINFLNNLPFFLKFGPVTILHGGLLNHQKLDSLSKRDKGRLLRLRFLDKNLKFIAFGDENVDSNFWADIYDGNEGFIVYGHQNFKEVRQSPNAIGIDTGCVYGNKLTAVVFKNLEIDSYSIHSVPAIKR